MMPSAGGYNLYQYAPNAFMWIDPWGWSCRNQYMGRTPNKRSKTGRTVIDRMREEGRFRGDNETGRFKSSTDGQWYSVKDADMAHKTDAVKYWNTEGGYYGPKSKEVRDFMKNPDNYELEYFRYNRSQGAKLRETYKHPDEFK